MFGVFSYRANENSRKLRVQSSLQVFDLPLDDVVDLLATTDGRYASFQNLSLQRPIPKPF
jgi:hypothetical protein